MYVIRVQRGGQDSYLARNYGRRPYRWADARPDHAVTFSTEEEAIEVAYGRERDGTVARVVWSPLSRGAEPPRRKRGFVIAVHGNADIYAVVRDGILRWGRGPGAVDEAFRFSSRVLAVQMMQRGFGGFSGVVAVVEELRY